MPRFVDLGSGVYINLDHVGGDQFIQNGLWIDVTGLPAEATKRYAFKGEQARQVWQRLEPHIEHLRDRS